MKAHYLFETMRPDEAAECLEGVTTPIYRKLWTFVKDYRSAVHGSPEEPCHGVDALSDFWHKLTEDEQIWLNDLATVHMEGWKPWRIPEDL